MKESVYISTDEIQSIRNNIMIELEKLDKNQLEAELKHLRLCNLAIEKHRNKKMISDRDNVIRDGYHTN